ncbi:hypothetical protein D3C76_831040 [compost metagenome]
MNIRQPLLIRPGHRPALVRREPVSVEVNQIDVMGRSGDAFLKNLRALIDQRQQAALQDFFLAYLATMEPQSFADFQYQHIDLRIVLSLTATRFIVVEAIAALLAKTAQFTQTVIHLHLWRILPNAGQLPGTPLQIDADHVEHAEWPHGETETLQRRIHLVRVSTLQQHFARLQHVGIEHAIADEAVAIARHHADLAHALAQRQCGLKHRWCSLGTTDNFQQLHDVRRTEKVQAQDLLRTACNGSDGINVQC